jgi:hypothetical protein
MTRAISVAILAVAPLLAAQSVSMPAWWRYSHPEAKTIIGADVAAIIHSPLGQRMSQEFGQAAAGFGPLWKSSAKGAQGMALLHGIDRVVISAPGPLHATKSNPPAAVVLLRGQFDLAGIREFVSSEGAVKSWHRKTEIWRDKHQSAGKLMMAVIDGQTLMLGDEASIRKSLDSQAAGVHPAANPLFRRAAELAGQTDFWMVSVTPPNSLAGTQTPMAAMFESVGSFELAVSVRSGLSLSVNLNHDSPESAAQMDGAFRALIQLALSTQKDPKLAALLQDRIRIGVEGPQVQLTAAWSQPELDAAIREMRSQVMAQASPGFGRARRTAEPAYRAAWPEPEITGSGGSTPAAAAPVNEPPRPLKVRIMNAEGGTREIDLTRK